MSTSTAGATSYFSVFLNGRSSTTSISTGHTDYFTSSHCICALPCVIHHRSRVTTPLTSQSFHAYRNSHQRPGCRRVSVSSSRFIPQPTWSSHSLHFSTTSMATETTTGSENPFAPNYRLTLLNSPTVHGFHHSNVQGNYGLYTNVWDRSARNLSSIPCPASSLQAPVRRGTAGHSQPDWPLSAAAC
jgi:hypothetical protein